MIVHKSNILDEVVSSLDLNEFPWSWHDKIYYGAAHGTTGILLTLHRLGKCDINHFILKLIELAYLPSGNFKSSSKSNNDELIQWCHGAPGFIPLLLEYYNDHIFHINTALDLIWSYGILKKGSGICHGIAGNGYAFLSTYRKTKNKQHLYQAVTFAEIILENLPEDVCKLSDHPYSLFEGLAGTTQYLLDLLIVLQEDPGWDTFKLFDGLQIF
jgi:lantibiotic modifying enzyme